MLASVGQAGKGKQRHARVQLLRVHLHGPGKDVGQLQVRRAQHLPVPPDLKQLVPQIQEKLIQEQLLLVPQRHPTLELLLIPKLLMAMAEPLLAHQTLELLIQRQLVLVLQERPALEVLKLVLGCPSSRDDLHYRFEFWVCAGSLCECVDHRVWCL